MMGMVRKADCTDSFLWTREKSGNVADGSGDMDGLLAPERTAEALSISAKGISDMQPDENTMVVRQIFFNRKLETLASEDCPDGMCKSYMYYVQKNRIAEEATWAEDMEEYDPFLELLILSERPEPGEPDLLPNFSYMVSFISRDELDKKQWREIRDKVQEHLRGFELEKASTKRKLFSLTGKDVLASAPKIALEILILSDRQVFDEPDSLLNVSSDEPNLLLNLSFMVSFVSSCELNIGQWRQIRDAVQKYLDDFELEYFMMEKRLFYPEDKDLRESGLKATETEGRLKAALELKSLYEDLLRRIRKNHKSRGFLKKLAAEYGMSPEEARSIFSPHPVIKRNQPAQLAKELLLKTKLAKINFISSVGLLEHEILHRKPRLFFDGYIKARKLKRPLVYTTKSAVFEQDSAVKTYNTQELRLKKLTVERVWHGQI